MLHGVPMVRKDTHLTKGIRTTFGPFGPMDLSAQGPMARSVDDLALLLGLMSGADPMVPGWLVTSGADVRPDPTVAARGLRLAIAPDFAGTIPGEREVAQAIEAAGRVFESLGAEV